jgi:UDP-4-amino-4,6-dideoxy-N-acetyl-beta-L-altrosamine transaminase
MIPYSTQTIEDDDVDAVTNVLRSPYLTCGPTVNEFEEQTAAYVNAGYAVAVNSCTSALHIAMMALGVSKSDRVFVSAISFVASANCARYLGAEVDFIDSDKFTGNLDVNHLEEMLIEAEKQNRLPKVVVAVHLSGRPVDLEKIYALKLKYGFYLIEDAAHALGAVYKGHKIGDCFFSDITVFSFHPVKIITTAEGGMCLTNSEELYRKMKSFSSHGIERDTIHLTDQNRPNYYYEMQTLGFNYRMSDVHASLGISQLAKVDDFLARRRALAKDWEELLSSDKNLTLPPADTEDSLSSWHLYQVGIPFGKRDYVYNTLRHRGICVQVHYLPIYKHPYYQSLKNYPALSGAEYFFERTLSLPLYPKLKKLDLQMCAATMLGLIDEKKQ